MQIPTLQIGHLKAKVPIVQGGMGVGISLSNLASAVARAGGIGVISAVEIGFNFPDYSRKKNQTNLEALRYHIRRAKELAPGGIIGVNIMVAINNFKDLVRTAVEEKVDLIFSGAGLPLNLPELVQGSGTKIAPIISSGRGAEIICRQWDRKYHYLPDAIVVEGPLAGGHLGYTLDELTSDNVPQLADIVKEVQERIRPYAEKYARPIPLIAGGGIVNGEQIGELLSHGAQGVQIGTLFALTHECDASLAWKNEVLRATKEDIIIIQSPVGMPGRAVRNQFLEEVAMGQRKPIRCTINCLQPCHPSKSPYCIADALINAQQGKLEEGFAFTGANAYQVRELHSVREVVERLSAELLAYEPELEPVLV